MSLIEAMSCGVPVVATRVGGMTDSVRDGENGLLVAPDNASELAQAIHHLLEQPEKRQYMGLAARRLAKSTFDWNTIADQTLNYYRALARN